LKKRVPEFEDMGLAERGDEETQGPRYGGKETPQLAGVRIKNNSRLGRK
jgi:hypothetical protein